MTQIHVTHAHVVRKLPAGTFDIDLPLPSGITALAGPSGAGKTLLLETIAGFAPADSGRILIDDAIVFDAAARVHLPARRRHCAYIPARDALFPRMTVRQNLMFAAARWARLERHKRVAEMLERFELTGAIDRRPADIAPGERLRAEIARAVALPELRRRYLERGIELGASASSEEFSTYLKSEVAAFARLAREANLKVD